MHWRSSAAIMNKHILSKILNIMPGLPHRVMSGSLQEQRFRNWNCKEHYTKEERP